MDKIDKTNEIDKRFFTLLKDNFDEMVVYKDQKSALFSSLSLPGFLRDWILEKFSNDAGVPDCDGIAEFISNHIPTLEGWQKFKVAIVKDCVSVKTVGKIQVDVSIKTQDAYFSLPDYGLSQKETIIEDRVWDECKDKLLERGEETWGVIELGYLPAERTRDKKNGKTKLVSFESFRPYDIDLDYYKDARKSFSTQEWLDVVIGALGYNSAAFSEKEKCAILERLLPFVENNLNLIELAPKGTGKTYIFSQISRFGKLVSASIVTRAAMFYNVARATRGVCSWEGLRRH